MCTPARTYFRRLEERFEAASSRAGESITTVLAVAGTTVSIRFAGDAMVPALLPALAHLAVDSTAPDGLTVLAFDSASTGVEPPPQPAETDAVDPDVVRILQRGAGFFSMLDHTRARAVLWTADARTVPYNEIAAPLRMILQTWFARRAWQLVHAGAVGTPDGGALIVGRSGAGKSTTALACLEAGLAFAGDDYILATTQPSPTVFGIYASAKLHETDFHRFPALATKIANPVREEDEKPVVLLGERYQPQLIGAMPLRAIVVPRFTGTDRPRARPTSAAAALAAAAPSTLFQVPLDRPAAMARLRQIVTSVPCWELETGPDLQAVVGAVRGLLGRPSGDRGGRRP